MWETDPDVIRQVLPPPLEPSEPLARIRFATVNMGTGIPIFGAGWFGVRARHGSQEGEYALFMPMTTEQATVGGRETYGEPKKIGAVAIDIQGDQVHAHMERMGFPLAEVRGTIGDAGRHRAARQDRLLLQAEPLARRQGLRHRTRAGRTCTGTKRRATASTIDGTLMLHDSPIDPIADIPVGRLVSLQFAQVATTQHGEVVERVPGGLAAPVRPSTLRRPVGARKEGLMSMSEAGRDRTEGRNTSGAWPERPGPQGQERER